MNISELRKKCTDAQQAGHDTILLTVPGQWTTQQHRKRLFPGGPLGQIIAQPQPGQCLCEYRCSEVIAALDRQVLSAIPSDGTCPTCQQPLSHLRQVTSKGAGEEVYVCPQGHVWRAV